MAGVVDRAEVFLVSSVGEDRRRSPTFSPRGFGLLAVQHGPPGVGLRESESGSVGSLVPLLHY